MSKDNNFCMTRLIPKEDINNEWFVGHLIDNMAIEIGKGIADALASGDEYICKMSDVQISTVPEQNAMKAIQYISIRKLVRCGECKRGFKSLGAKYCCGEYRNLDWFCVDGERKDDE